jgi:hypothetical protein
MTEATALLILIAVIIFQQATWWVERKAKDKMISDLHTRLMANSLPEYARASKLMKSKPDEPVTVREREEALKAAFEDTGLYDVGT